MFEKYDFKKLKSSSNKEPLPDKINEQVESWAVKLNDVAGAEDLKRYRENRWFGKVYLWDEKGRLIVTALIDHGICFRYEVNSYRKCGILPAGMLSVKNKYLKNEKKVDSNANETQRR